ncbi:hypothetical protein FB451DRAFT_1170362 [Mycena latifolia]|nr:hypothetical protein FB451DRAFT_1170362 [Mycena latifolia]
MPVAWPEALRPDKPGPLRPSQARPNVGLDRAQGLGLRIFKPEPGPQALAWIFTTTDLNDQIWIKCGGAGGTYSGPGSGPSQARPSPTSGLGLWPEESQAQARSSQATGIISCGSACACLQHRISAAGKGGGGGLAGAAPMRARVAAPPGVYKRASVPFVVPAARALQQRSRGRSDRRALTSQRRWRLPAMSP